MFGIFSKSKRKQIVEKAVMLLTPEKNVEELIQDIHNAFDIAGDEALVASNKFLETNIVSQDDIEEAKLLEKLGFNSSPKLNKVNSKLADINIARKRAEIVRKYTIKYPQYKFIFEDQVKAICKKYKLICAEVSKYKGSIPKKNLLEIANFKVNAEDKYYNLTHWRWGNTGIIDKTSLDRRESGEYTHTPLPFLICAPESDMNTTGLTPDEDKVFFKQKEIPDPIVLHNVIEGYLIVSKWGLEGQDPALVNETMN